MSKKIAGFTMNQVCELSVWVAKFQGWRKVGSYAEVNATVERNENELRDFDLCAVQPDILAPFFEEQKRLEKLYGWMTWKDLFEKYGEG